ncbi:MAG TPA: hypothetical protein VG605_14330 [Puia sp.]|nr:hypothetical protein [Puia sp.]
MKKLFFPFITGLALVCSVGATAQEFKEHITREFPISAAASGQLAIYNLNGPIKVEGYAGDKVVVDIDKTITADDNDRLAIGKSEFRLGFDQHGDSIVVYIAEPFDTRPHRWENWNGNDRKIDYDFQLSFTVRVPYSLGLKISTVNRGDISVKDVAGTLDVNNVNGPITIKNARGATNARTINGDLTVSYLDTPPAISDYYTLNGTLSVTYPRNMSAICQFKSMNGSFYTDFPDVEILPAQVTKNQEHHGGGVTYKLNIAKQIKIGNGGKLFKFETMNGDIYVKKQS